MESIRDRNQTQSTTKNISWVFFQEQTHQLIERPAVEAIIHKNLTLIIFFTSKESFPAGNLLRHTWNIHFKHLPNTGSLTQICINFFAASPFLSLLREHKFKYYFQDTVNLLCSRSLEAESTYHLFLCCQNFTNLCKYLMK